MTTPHENKALVKRAIRALTDHDRATFIDLHHQDTVLHDGDRDIRGIDAIADHEFAFFSAFPDLTIAPEQLVAEGDMVAAQWAVSGTHEGAFMGAEPTGAEVEFGAMGLFRIEDDRIAEVSLMSDLRGLYRQLDIDEFPGE